MMSFVLKKKVKHWNGKVFCLIKTLLEDDSPKIKGRYWETYKLKIDLMTDRLFYYKKGFWRTYCNIINIEVIFYL